MSTTQSETQLKLLLEVAAKKLSFQNFSIDLDSTAQKGDGFLGEVYKASITDQNTNKKIYVFIKKAPVNKTRREETAIDTAYKNEVHFYETIFPAFRSFQVERRISPIFDSIPSYITSSIDEKYNEMIVLEDITKMGYQMIDKKLLLDDEHLKFIFEAYGRFHALSFCLKDQSPEEYSELIKGISENILAEFGTKQGFPRAVRDIVKKSFEAANLEGDQFKEYTEDAAKIYRDVVNYKGKYSCILHGDCWSNNIMFKYENSKIESIRFLDFQLMWIGSPVYDLSYFFYSGASYESFQKLEHYLDVYYSSFSKFSEELGSDPHSILPRKQLSDDWRLYSKFGMIMALLLTPIKLMSREDSVEAIESMGKEGKDRKKMTSVDLNKQVFDQRVSDVLNHMCEINAL